MSKGSPVGGAQRGPERRPVLKIILLGDSGVGKTSLMRQFVSGKFESRYKATIGADFFTHEEIIDGRPVNLQIWDTAGQERFQSLGSAFYRGADACMIVFDITSNESFSHITTWLQEFTLQAGQKDMVLIGNKADVQERRQVYNRGIQQWCAEQGGDMQYFETSAKQNTHVGAAFRAVATAAYRAKTAKQGGEEPPMMAGSIKSLKKDETPPPARGKDEKKCAC
ncbi:rab7 GTP-binding protein, putative [Bodo saltans]|uniref:Ras-related protein Rab-7b n=2 Tax=Bodo saltans TaxID=75058 RepID=A0A0S4KGN8_BODSA|nr:rab7 GTP-binding protein, putative [Bodo saltans]|eukprot:CUI14775.1 rab7 GTP-binding protein, putative [Bodo saltans]